MSGPDPNALCIFPFEYNGEIFNECTDKEHDQMWCHTSEDWGNCGPDCTTSSGTPSSSTPMSIAGNTVPIDRIISVKNGRAWVSMDFK